MKSHPLSPKGERTGKGNLAMSEISRFEAESKLFDALQLLRNPENMEKIRDRIVGDFWNPEFRRAPFEECLTFKQLASIQYDTLIKKRSLDSDKMVALADAVRKAVREPTSGRSSASSNHTSSNFNSTKQFVTWEKAEKFTDVSASLFCLGIVASLNLMSPDHPYVRVLKRMFQGFNPDEFLTVWFSSQDRAKDCLALGINLTEKEIVTLANKSSAKMRVMIAEESPELQLHWSTALSGAGAYLETLVSPYFTTAVSSNLYYEVSRVLIWALGGRPVIIGERPLKDHYSLSPVTAGSVVKAISSGKKTKTELRDTFSLPFPFFDLDILIEHFTNTKAKKLQSSMKMVSNRSKPKKR